MATIVEFAQRWADLIYDDGIWKEAIELTKEGLIEVNQDQLKDGKSSAGMNLPEYKPFELETGEEYGDMKRRMNPRNEGRFDMYLTGHSFSTMRAELEGDKFRIMGEGWADSFNRSGETRGLIWGLYEGDHLKKYRTNILYPTAVRLIRDKTGAK
jgi:hypothetical protein